MSASASSARAGSFAASQAIHWLDNKTQDTLRTPSALFICETKSKQYLTTTFNSFNETVTNTAPGANFYVSQTGMNIFELAHKENGSTSSELTRGPHVDADLEGGARDDGHQEESKNNDFVLIDPLTNNQDARQEPTPRFQFEAETSQRIRVLTAPVQPSKTKATSSSSANARAAQQTETTHVAKLTAEETSEDGPSGERYYFDILDNISECGREWTIHGHSQTHCIQIGNWCDPY